MKVRKLNIEDMKAGNHYIVKPTNGNYPVNGFVFTCAENGKFSRPRVKNFDFVYLMQEEEVTYIINKPADVMTFPFWSAGMEKFAGTELNCSCLSIETYEEEGSDFNGKQYILNNDNVGFSPAWLSPKEMPEFFDEKYKAMFVPTEVALPKKPLTFTETKLLERYSEQILQVKAAKGATANWITMVGDKEIHNFGNACHANLSSVRANGADVIISGIKNKMTDADKYFYWYLANESCYKDCFLLKDVQKMEEIECVICSTDVPANLLAGALIATRQQWEYHDRVESFYQLAKLGLPNNLAFYLGNFAHCNVDNLTFDFTLGSSGHNPIDCEVFTDKTLVEFINTGTVMSVGEKLANYRDSTTYRRVFAYFGEAKGETTSLYNDLVELSTEGGGWKVIKKPFEHFAETIQLWVEKHVLNQ